MKIVSPKTLTVLTLMIGLLWLRYRLHREWSEKNQGTEEKEEQKEESEGAQSIESEGKGEHKTELSDLIKVYEERRLHVGQMCREYKEEIKLRYAERWPDRKWETFVGKADVLEKKDQGFLWCKVPKAASESWTTLFIKRW